MEENHIFKNVFSIDVDLPKSNLFALAVAMLWPRVIMITRWTPRDV